MHPSNSATLCDAARPVNLREGRRRCESDLKIVDRRSGRPRRVLQDDAISVGILESDAAFVPIGIERGDRRCAESAQTLDCGAPCRTIRQIENEQIVFGRRAADRMAALMGEFEMPWNAGMAEHDAVKAVMILKPADLVE